MSEISVGKNQAVMCIYSNPQSASIAQDISWVSLLNASMNSRDCTHNAQYADKISCYR